MKTKLTYGLLILFISSTVYSQEISKKEASQLFDNAIKYIKTNDTTSFIKLWYLDNKPRPNNQNPYSQKDIKWDFVQLKLYMDSAFTQNLSINSIDIEKQTTNEGIALGKYLIRAMYKYNKYYYKGFGFYLDYVDNKWVIKNSPKHLVKKIKLKNEDLW